MSDRSELDSPDANITRKDWVDAVLGIENHIMDWAVLTGISGISFGDCVIVVRPTTINLFCGDILLRRIEHQKDSGFIFYRYFEELAESYRLISPSLGRALILVNSVASDDYYAWVPDAPKRPRVYL